MKKASKTRRARPTKRAKRPTRSKPAKRAKATKAKATKATKAAKATKATKAAKPAKATKPAKPSGETPIEIGARMGARCGVAMSLEGESTSPDEATLQEWAYDWFLNNGGFDAIKGFDDNDPVQGEAIKQAFFDAFKRTMRSRLGLPTPP